MPDAQPLAVPVAPEATYRLRRDILNRPPTTAELHGDVTGWGHYAVIIGGAVIATGITHPQNPPEILNQHRGDAWRIIGMAVDPPHRRHGIGALLLEARIAHARAADGRFVWCHARSGAATLYRRHGFDELPQAHNDPVAGRQLLMGRRT